MFVKQDVTPCRESPALVDEQAACRSSSFVLTLYFGCFATKAVVLTPYLPVPWASVRVLGIEVHTWCLILSTCRFFFPSAI